MPRKLVWFWPLLVFLLAVNILLGLAGAAMPDARGYLDHLAWLDGWAFWLVCAAWSYHSVAAIQAAGRGTFFITPWQAVRGWLIPILWFFRPFYQLSATIRFATNPALPEQELVFFVPSVWICWLGLAASWVLRAMANSAEELQRHQHLQAATDATHALAMAALLVAFWQAYRAQERLLA